MTYLHNQGHEVEIIDYKPKYFSLDYQLLLNVYPPRWGKNIFLKITYSLLKLTSKLLRFPRKHAFDVFTHNHLKLTVNRYTSNEELRSNPPKADAYICGSDQIWNCNLPNGHDPAFYLDFAPRTALKISYAASFAMDEIPDKLKNELRQRIDKIDHISVREADAVGHLRYIGINRGIHVLDPVFLLDRSDWENMAKPIAKGKYILIYSFDNQKVIVDAANKVAAIRNCPIYAANSTPLRGVDKNFRYASPNEFLGLIMNAEYIVTNSFHAIAFALIFNVEFLALGRTEKLNSRMTDLLRTFQLEHRYFGNGLFNEKQLLPIDYQVVKKKIEKLVQQSTQFLDNALDR
jgi:hypothetical protein